MTPIEDNQDNNIRQREGERTDRTNDPLKRTYENPENESNTEQAENDESSAPRTDDLDSGTFTDRPHGRTNPPLGPDHEPGTHG